MNPTLLQISTDDHRELSLLLRGLSHSSANTPGQKLRGELERAIILDPKVLPPTVVVMGSTAELEDLGTGDVDSYTLCFPEQANPDAGRLSVLAPIGTAIIGCKQGDEVRWPTPGGMRRLRIRRVTRSPHIPDQRSTAPVAVSGGAV